MPSGGKRWEIELEAFQRKLLRFSMYIKKTRKRDKYVELLLKKVSSFEGENSSHQERINFERNFPQEKHGKEANA